MSMYYSSIDFIVNSRGGLWCFVDSSSASSQNMVIYVVPICFLDHTSSGRELSHPRACG